jgi:hypothetical protein
MGRAAVQLARVSKESCVKWFHDSNGDVSSKRIFGSAVILSGLVFGFWGGATGRTELVDYSKWIIGFGSGLLGFGVFEKMKA